MCALSSLDYSGYVTLLLPGNTPLPVPSNGPGRTDDGPKWRRTREGIVATYTAEELEWALAVVRMSSPLLLDEEKVCQHELMTTKQTG